MFRISHHGDTSRWSSVPHCFITSALCHIECLTLERRICLWNVLVSTLRANPPSHTCSLVHNASSWNKGEISDSADTLTSLKSRRMNTLNDAEGGQWAGPPPSDFLAVCQRRSYLLQLLEGVFCLRDKSVLIYSLLYWGTFSLGICCLVSITSSWQSKLTGLAL